MTMTPEELGKTTIGADYLECKQLYPVDSYLDYLLMLTRCRDEHEPNWVWKIKYDLEIEATKELLRKTITK